jgi:hypothetical protein
MPYVVAPHAPNRAHFARVAEEMLVLGAPTIRAWWDGEKWIALEGTHRIAAASRLGMTPVIEEFGLGDEIDHDFEDVLSRSVSDLVEHLRDSAAYYRFDELRRGTSR